jgi:hypothetical protein
MSFVSKQILAEQLLNIVNGGIINKDSKVTIRQAMFAVSEARNKIIQNELFQRYSQFGSFDVPGSVLSDFVVKSYLDEASGKYFLDLPKQVLSLYNDMGVYHLSVVGDSFNDFIPVKKNFNYLYRDLASNRLESQKGYILSGDKLELIGVSNVNDFDIVLIVDGHELEPREDFKFLSERQFDLIPMALEILRMQVGIPQDTVLDNEEKTR